MWSCLRLAVTHCRDPESALNLRFPVLCGQLHSWPIVDEQVQTRIAKMMIANCWRMLGTGVASQIPFWLREGIVSER